LTPAFAKLSSFSEGEKAGIVLGEWRFLNKRGVIEMTVAIKFAGWVRLPGRLWERVVEAESEDAAWGLLRRHVHGET
jgi:hypothetical protein